MADLCIKNCTLVTPEEMHSCDITVEKGMVSGLHRMYTGHAATEIDAQGDLVMPGMIDAHTHMELSGYGTVSCDDFHAGTAAAIHGGVTTIIDFTCQTRGKSVMDSVRERMALAQSKVLIDYSLHAGVTEFTDAVQEEIPEVVGFGIPSFKIFTIYPAMMMTDGEILSMLEAATVNNAMCMFHCENSSVVDELTRRLVSRGHLGAYAHPQSRPDFCEAEAVSRIATLAGAVGASAYIVHLSSAAGLAAVRKAQCDGVNLLCETCPQYLVLDDTIFNREDGHRYLCSPPMRTREDSVRLWEGLSEGSISVVATDHCPFTSAQKDPFANDFRTVPMGLPGIETLLPLVFTEGIGGGYLDACEVVSMLSTMPARIFGLYPRKGHLNPGADADIIIVDHSKTRVISHENLHMGADYSPYAGKELTGFPRVVISRGEVVMKDGVILGKPGRGKFIRRKLEF
ncbi:MAG: dihydropyrimidinase [Candidatus Wallbacteria bacterium HGW-Wallbacteria-1]|jgi:dihydropyrimidinase|uniref:D-hydantoinase n=1 Tax=Candidatus Wallbacteria bacterium HGW-Wallbacteria-1 TaxID=2013854 RepID=A0A2N1PLJ3_9BACT|nr:MAG: dihydropyrimidinase [Candidatus Wallbacteria bacterium HGW-Wallbacteria-1]